MCEDPRAWSTITDFVAVSATSYVAVNAPAASTWAVTCASPVAVVELSVPAYPRIVTGRVGSHPVPVSVTVVLSTPSSSAAAKTWTPSTEKSTEAFVVPSPTLRVTGPTGAAPGTVKLAATDPSAAVGTPAAVTHAPAALQRFTWATTDEASPVAWIETTSPGRAALRTAWSAMPVTASDVLATALQDAARSVGSGVVAGLMVAVPLVWPLQATRRPAVSK